MKGASTSVVRANALSKKRWILNAYRGACWPESARSARVRGNLWSRRDDRLPVRPPTRGPCEFTAAQGRSLFLGVHRWDSDTIRHPEVAGQMTEELRLPSIPQLQELLRRKLWDDVINSLASGDWDAPAWSGRASANDPAGSCLPAGAGLSVLRFLFRSCPRRSPALQETRGLPASLADRQGGKQLASRPCAAGRLQTELAVLPLARCRCPDVLNTTQANRAKVRNLGWTDSSDRGMLT